MKNWIDLVGNASETQRLDERMFSGVPSTNMPSMPMDRALETDNETAARRLGDVTRRANDEKKSYGFLRSLGHKVFGKKAPEAPFSRPERSEEERRASVVNRARAETQTVDEDLLLSPEPATSVDNPVWARDPSDTFTVGWVYRGQFETLLNSLREKGQITSFEKSDGQFKTMFTVNARTQVLSALTRTLYNLEHSVNESED